MIRNLNQVNFCSYGSVLPERAHASLPFSREDADLTALDSDCAPIYMTHSETWLSGSSGMAILSICARKDEYLHFYLDKPVSLKSGVQFALSAFMGNASVSLYAAEEKPEPIGFQTVQLLREDRKLHVDGIYTFFYQEKEQGFLFPGEAHPMPELTYVDQGELHSVVDGQDLLLKQGDLVIYGPNQWHMAIRRYRHCSPICDHFF